MLAKSTRVKTYMTCRKGSTLIQKILQETAHPKPNTSIGWCCYLCIHASSPCLRIYKESVEAALKFWIEINLSQARLWEPVSDGRGVIYFSMHVKGDPCVLIMAMAGRRAVAQSVQPPVSPASMVWSESLYVCFLKPFIMSAQLGSTKVTCKVTSLATRRASERKNRDITHFRAMAAWGSLGVESPFPIQRIPSGQ